MIEYPYKAFTVALAASAAQCLIVGLRYGLPLLGNYIRRSWQARARTRSYQQQISLRQWRKLLDATGQKLLGK